MSDFDTGYLTFATLFTDTSLGSHTWDTGYANMFTCNGVTNEGYSTGGSHTYNYYIVGTGIGGPIPDGYKIVGVEYRIRRKENAGLGFGDVNDESIRLYKSSFIGDDKAIPSNLWTQTLVYASSGGDGDLWGLELEDKDINDVNFGAGIATHFTNNMVAEIDCINLKIFYDFPSNMLMTM